MPALPYGPKLPNVNFVKPDIVGKKQLIFLLSVCALLLIIVFFFINFSSSSQKQSKPSFNIKSFEFNDTNTQKYAIKLYEDAQKEQDKTKKLELYKQVFGLTLTAYGLDHNAKTREQVEELKKYIAVDIGSSFVDSDFNVPCFDFTCNPNTSTPQAIADIVAKVSAMEKLDKSTQKSILNKIDSAVYAQNEQIQFDNYLVAFSLLAAESRRTKDEEVTNNATGLLKFLKNTYPIPYNDLEQRIPEALSL